MKKTLTAASPIAALIALKCPLCFLAFAGISAGLGSFLPVIKTVYLIIILALSAFFIVYLLKSWKSELIRGWILGVGLLGVGILIYQVAAEPTNATSYLPGILLTITSLCALFFCKKTKRLAVISKII